MAILVASGVQAAWPFGDSEREELGARAADLLVRLIRIPTTQPPVEKDAELRVAKLMVEELEAAGVDARTLPLPRAADGSGGAAAWGRLRGNGAGAPIVLLSHLDVVPADADEWSVPPFEGRLANGIVSGRGALDAKGVAVVHLMTLVELARRDERLSRDVIFLSTPDEESGGRGGAGFLTKEQPELFDGVEYLLTEGGGIRLSRSGTPTLWGVTVTEKSPCWLELRTRGTPGHGSSPNRDAAVPRLVAALDKVSRADSPLRVLPAVERMFASLAPLAEEEDREGYRSLRESLAGDKTFRRRFLANPSRSALVRNTVSITVLSGSSRVNVVPAEARARVDIRLLPGERCEDFSGALQEVIDDPQVSVRTLLSFPARSSPADTPLYRAIEQVAAERDPDALVVPRMIGGFTDAHWFRGLGIVAYGFVPRWLAAEDARGVHGPDEHVSVENLERGVGTLIEILEALDAAEKP